MERYNGKSVFKGIAIGKIHIYKKDEEQIKRIHIENPDDETKRFEDAKEKAIVQLKLLYEKALKEVGEANAMIFEVHQMMLLDPDYIQSVYNIIETQKVNAEYAVASTSDSFSEIFSLMDDEYMRERAADIKDISNRVISILYGNQEVFKEEDEPYILIADDLSPSETVQMDKEKLISFVIRGGSQNSHTAILARNMSIPSLIKTDIPIDLDIEGKTGVVDGYNGIFYVEPDEEFLLEMSIKQKKDIEEKRILLELKGKDNITTDGRKIDIYANIGGVSDLATVLQNDAGGIGLFRSEFLYLQNDHFPTEEEQFVAYRKVAAGMAGKKVIIRTLDIGADKQVDYFGLQKEENPAMGLRAIRICLERPEIFKTQLRALFRASVYGNIAIMYPMIISVEEVRKIKEIVRSVKKELSDQNIPYKDVEEGIMIETPASVMISEELAKEVDFFSIGTNDLTQYTLAIDRQNQSLDNFYNSHHTAVLKMIRMTVENGHKGGCMVGICGELAADTSLTETFIDMGVDELSVSPSYILSLRQKVRSI